MPTERRRRTAIARSEDIMNRYDDIINREYKGVTSRKRMCLESRAAQFAPFAALTGHDKAINETARLAMEKLMSSSSPEEFWEL